MTFETVHAEACLGLEDFGSFGGILLRFVSFKFFKIFNFLLSTFSFNFTFFALLFSLSLVDLLFGLLNGSFALIVGSLALVFAITEVHVDIFIFEVHGVTVAVFSSQELLERLKVLGEELAHTGYSESSNVTVSAEGLDGEFFKMQDTVELVLEFVKSNSGPLDVVGDLLLGFFNLSVDFVGQVVEVVAFDVEVLVIDSDSLLDTLVFVG